MYMYKMYNVSSGCMFYCYVELSSLLAQAKEQAELEQERKEEEKRRAHVRPWDRGKGTMMCTP